MIGFSNDLETKEENEKFFAHIVRELTGDWIMEIECQHIQTGAGHKTLDEVIYFGPADDLKKGGEAWLVSELSMMDRFNFDESRAFFGVNEDPECRK